MNPNGDLLEENVDLGTYKSLLEFPSTDQEIIPRVDFGYNFALSDNFLLGISLGATFGDRETQINDSFTLDNTTGFYDYDELNYTDGTPDSGGSSGTDGTPASGGTDGTYDADWSLSAGLDQSELINTYLDPSKDSTVSIGNIYSIALKPSFAITDSTMLYLKASYNFADATVNDSDLSIKKTNIHGFGFGLGIETNIGNGWYFMAEAEQIKMKGSIHRNVFAYDFDASPEAGTTPTLDNFDFNHRSDEFEVETSTISANFGIGYRF